MPESLTPEEWGKLIVAAQGLVRADANARAAWVANDPHLARAWESQVEEGVDAIIDVAAKVIGREVNEVNDAIAELRRQYAKLKAERDPESDDAILAEAVCPTHGSVCHPVWHKKPRVRDPHLHKHPHPCEKVMDGAGCDTCDTWLDQLAEKQGHPDPCDYTIHATFGEVVDHLLFEDGKCQRRLADPKGV